MRLRYNLLKAIQKKRIHFKMGFLKNLKAIQMTVFKSANILFLEERNDKLFLLRLYVSNL
ncbi:hypothetical protein GCM10023261_16760 [Bartonella jaculi]|uniref:Uncharacterized protein n=1 Tax=Bartonella jaculi TaxID=686226 RepID=A0ABP9NFL5_9HYPH